MPKSSYKKEEKLFSAKKDKKNSTHTIKETLKHSLVDFEKKLDKLECELNEGFFNKKFLANNSFPQNEQPKCILLDKKIDYLYEKMKNSQKVI